ncbi:MAG TPA: hypothetical protein VK422_14945 [Pyrinomonadaceae bacterium]|nr:hypothetical protein [Pyrinomonadaceae bacterium]
MRKVFGVLTLTAVLAYSAHAGIIPNADEPPPPPPTSSSTMVEADAAHTANQPEDGPTPADTAADITLLLVRGVLSLF